MKRMNVALALLLGAALAAPSLSTAQMSTNSQSNLGSAVGSVTGTGGAFHIDRFEKRGRKIYAVGWFLGGVNDQSSAYFSPGAMMEEQSSTNGGAGNWSSSGSSGANSSSYAGEMGSSWSDDTLGLASAWDTAGDAYSDQMSSTASGWNGSGVSGRSSFGYNVGGNTGIGGSYGRSYSTYGNGATRLGMGSSVGTPSSRDLGNVDALSSSITTTGGSTDLRTSGGADVDLLGDTLGMGVSSSASLTGYGPDLGYGYDFQSGTGTNYDTTVDYSAAINPVGSGTVVVSGDLNTDWASGDTVLNENLIGPNPTIAASGSLGAGYDVTPGSVVTGGSAAQGSMSTTGNMALQGSTDVSGPVRANSDLATSGAMASGLFYGDTAGMVRQGASMQMSTIDETALPVTFLGASCEGVSMQLGAASSGFVHVGNPSNLSNAVGGPIAVELRPSTVYAQGIDVRYDDLGTPVVATYVSDVSGNTSLCEVSKLINGDAARTAIVDELNHLIGAPITGPARNGVAR